MAQAQKKSKGTPGRPKKSSTQYFDIGKVGRKTGVTLEDKGLRDENGLEPLEHIFSSPVRKVDGAVGSSDGLMQESSGPEVDKTLISRKTPRLPPPRASTPKYTNIGSPKRMSTGRARAQATDGPQDSSPSRPLTQQPANRLLDFNADTVHKSIEKPSPSPFKPRHVLRRSNAASHPFSSPTKVAEPIIEHDEGESEQYEQHVDDAPIMLDDDDDNYYEVIPDDDEVGVEDVQAGAVEDSPSDARTARGQPLDISINGSQIQPSPAASASASSKKRQRVDVEEDQVDQDPSLSQSQISESGPAKKKQRGKNSKKVVIHHRNGEDETIDPALLAYGDTYEVDTSLEAAVTQPAKGKGKGKKGKAHKEKDRNQAVRSRGSPVKLNESPSKLRQSREKSAGPINMFHLRATTPFEDAGSRVSRFGRNLIQPLKYWANEARIYKRGEIEGIVRAEEVEKPKPKRPKRKNKRVTSLEDIEEESDAESVIPDEWEDEVGVIGGMVANWDPETQSGVPEDLIREDLAFASSSIVTREVANSDFRYAKIMTLPFFGSGIVELPPEATKRIKNSRKMQMCFFVHEGQVMVEIGAAGAKDVTQFAISKGGVWVVPRGNNYAITNESKTRTARIFFAQGNEVQVLAAGEGAAAMQAQRQAS